MNEHFQLDVRLTLLGPLLTRGGQMIEPGMDASLARDAFERYMLPFSLIKGKVLDALRDLYPDRFENDRVQGRQGPLDSQFVDWFGQEPRDGGYDPERGRLRFSDFHTMQTGSAEDGVIERIQIDAKSGCAAGRMLAMIESPFGYDEQVEFAGRVEFIATEDEANEIQETLEAALRWTPAFGAMRTVGFGRTHSVETTLSRSPRRHVGRPELPNESAPAVLGLSLVLDRPLCVVGRKHSQNHFESLDSIGGAVLKGAVARLLLETTGASSAGRKFVEPGLPGFPALSRHFAELRFTEARPATLGDERRPVEPPLSTVVAPSHTDTYFDVALLPEACLIADQSPAFQPDWKLDHHALVRREFGWPDVPRERRTRTAIEPTTGRAADERLFSYGLVLPEFSRHGVVGRLQWHAEIGLGDVPEPERRQVVDELAMLLANGLPHLGKTRATASIEWRKSPTPAAVRCDRSRIPEGVHVITLQTEFPMTDPERLIPDPVAGLPTAYEEYWRDASDGEFTLIRYFARQALYGGFQAARSRRPGYEPFLLTERGSTFVLQTRDPTAAERRVAAWRYRGIPTPAWIARRYQMAGLPLWRCCPFLPHVGHGEIAIDLACHSRLPRT